MQQNPTIFSMETEVLDSVSLSVKVEPVSLERQILLPECVNCGRQVFSPLISLADDGEINSFWNVDDIYVDLDFYGNGQCSYFAQSKFGQKVYSNAFHTSEGFSPDILEFFLETR